MASFAPHTKLFIFNKLKWFCSHTAWSHKHSLLMVDATCHDLTCIKQDVRQFPNTPKWPCRLHENKFRLYFLTRQNNLRLKRNKTATKSESNWLLKFKHILHNLFVLRTKYKIQSSYTYTDFLLQENWQGPIFSTESLLGDARSPNYGDLMINFACRIPLYTQTLWLPISPKQFLSIGGVFVMPRSSTHSLYWLYAWMIYINFLSFDTKKVTVSMQLWRWREK